MKENKNVQTVEVNAMQKRSVVCKMQQCKDKMAGREAVSRQEAEKIRERIGRQECREW